MSMSSINQHGNRLEKLGQLAALLAQELDEAEDTKAIPQLAKQYRETIREIEELEGAGDQHDEIGEILSGRNADGKPGAVRKDRSRL